VVGLAVADPPCQLEVARRVSDGKTNHEIARAIRFSVRTVEEDMKAIFRTLGLRNRTQVAAWYRMRRRPTGQTSGPAEP